MIKRFIAVCVFVSACHTVERKDVGRSEAVSWQEVLNPDNIVKVNGTVEYQLPAAIGTGECVMLIARVVEGSSDDKVSLFSLSPISFAVSSSSGEFKYLKFRAPIGNAFWINSENGEVEVKLFVFRVIGDELCAPLR